MLDDFVIYPFYNFAILTRTLSLRCGVSGWVTVGVGWTEERRGGGREGCYYLTCVVSKKDEGRKMCIDSSFLFLSSYYGELGEGRQSALQRLEVLGFVAIWCHSSTSTLRHL